MGAIERVTHGGATGYNEAVTLLSGTIKKKYSTQLSQIASDLISAPFAAPFPHIVADQQEVPRVVVSNYNDRIAGSGDDVIALMRIAAEDE